LHQGVRLCLGLDSKPNNRASMRFDDGEGIFKFASFTNTVLRVKKNAHVYGVDAKSTIILGDFVKPSFLCRRVHRYSVCRHKASEPVADDGVNRVEEPRGNLVPVGDLFFHSDSIGVMIKDTTETSA
jgi:hypothetical protein